MINTIVFDLLFFIPILGITALKSA